MKPNHLGNYSKRDADPDLSVREMVSQKLIVDDMLGMCYDSDLDLSEDESGCDEGEEVHAYLDSELFSLRRWQLFSELSYLVCSSASLVQNYDSSADAVNQGNFEGE